MSGGEHHIWELIARARNGDRDALGELLERHRGYLKVIAFRFLDGRHRGEMGGRVDASDVVQQTCLSAFRNFERFAGEQPDDFLAWMRDIHEKNLKDAFREHVILQKRSITNEQSHEGGVAPATATGTSASQRLLNNEQTVELTRAMDALPDDQAEAVRLRFLEGLPMAEIGVRMNRSVDAVVGLIRRGIVALRGKLNIEE